MKKPKTYTLNKVLLGDDFPGLESLGDLYAAGVSVHKYEDPLDWAERNIGRLLAEAVRIDDPGLLYIDAIDVEPHRAVSA